MKRSEFITIIFIASVSMVLSFVLTQAIFGGSSNESVTVKSAEPIQTTIIQPDPDIFNSSVINPTYEVTITGSDSEGE